MKRFIEKYKVEILLFLLFFLLYFIVGTVLSYYLNTTKYWDILFSLDTPRVFGRFGYKGIQSL